jgi:glycosyltransferase involved in cell wall biosynthesis
MNERPIRVAMMIADERDEKQEWALPRPYFGTAPTALLEGMAGLPGLELHLVSCERQPVAPGGALAENVFFHPVQISRWSFLRTAYVGAILRTRKVLRKIHPDLVHGQGTERYQAMTAVFSGFRSLLTIHGNMRAVARALGAKALSFHGLTGRLEALALRRCDGVICLSNYTQREVGNLAAKTWVLPNAVGPEFFQVDRASRPRPTILCVGRICNYKNQNALIRALDAVAEALSIRVRFAGGVGTDDYGKEFLRLVAERPWCEFLSFLSPAQLRVHLAETDVLAHPSLEDNCPMVILEAMAAGVPVVASSIGGIPDLVQHEVTGLLCDPAQMEVFIAGIAKILTQPLVAASFGLAGRKRALERFKPEVVAREHLSIYREYAGGKDLAAREWRARATS